ncbi:MAG: hypothetical protein BAJALOKI3v1_50003 [Promethearchaeota archaeon]|nr:MAG: hypothetical protein BAJALOKI3v1_50003 [Candidatus Lokiarchaeota archaeon]
MVVQILETGYLSVHIGFILKHHNNCEDIGSNPISDIINIGVRFMFNSQLRVYRIFFKPVNLKLIKDHNINVKLFVPICLGYWNVYRKMFVEPNLRRIFLFTDNNQSTPKMHCLNTEFPIRFILLTNKRSALGTLANWNHSCERIDHRISNHVRHINISTINTTNTIDNFVSKKTMEWLTFTDL